MGEFNYRIRHFVSQSDFVLAIAIFLLLILLLMPLPTFLLDILLSLNIVLSVIALLLTLYVENALEFNSFPSFLLFLTLYRLGLNIASTRMILTQADAGDIIRTFGEFVTSGNLAVGIILFLLLTIINFVVVTKGSGRIAEVAARFILEALPGKQLAIDGELSSGLITQEEAKKEREKISKEADFYGAMDGASKFVRGDAIAGLFIIAVNIVGGLFVGFFMQGLPLNSCITTFTCLTVGDGLVSQIPALLVSIGSGIMVTRASSGSLGEALTKQLFNHPKVLSLAAITILLLSFVPGMPILVMIPIGGLLLFCAYHQFKHQEKDITHEKKSSPRSLFVHPIEVELGYHSVVHADSLYQSLHNIRKHVEEHLGIRIPQIEISDNADINPRGFTIRIKGVKVASGIDVDPIAICKSLTKLIEKHSHELITRQDLAHMIQEVKRYDSAVVDELIEKKLSLGQLLNILQNLLKEGVPIRDFITILEVLADNAKGESSDLDLLTEKVRLRLSYSISEEFFGKTHMAHAILIDPKVEQTLNVSQGKIRPTTVENLIQTILQFTQDVDKQGVAPIILTDVSVRRRVKKLVEKRLPDMNVLSYQEVGNDVEVIRIGVVPQEVLI